jgi:hypothetical protein
MTIKKLSREEVIDLIKPHGIHGDKKIHDAFVKYTTQGEGKLTQLTCTEVKHIIGYAGDGGVVEKRENQCLYNILDYIVISAKAKMYLNRFLEIKKSHRRNTIIPVSDSLEKMKQEVVSQASRIPIHFILPDEPAFVYKFSYFHTIARLLEAGLISMFTYTGGNEGNCGFYTSRKDCLMYRANPYYSEDSVIIHEATHAIQDMMDWDADRGHTEAAAHLAQAVWLLIKTPDKPLPSLLGSSAISNTAKRILSKMPSINGDKLVTIAITQKEYDNIREALKLAYNIIEPAAKKSVDEL